MSDRPEHFEGTVTIEWTPEGPSPMRGWRFMISDEGGASIDTVTALTLHASADSTVWAELTMFCTTDGKPIRTGDIGLPPCYGTFAFEVAAMGVTEPSAPIPPRPVTEPPGGWRPEPRRFQYPVGYGAGGHE